MYVYFIAVNLIKVCFEYRVVISPKYLKRITNSRNISREIIQKDNIFIFEVLKYVNFAYKKCHHL